MTSIGKHTCTATLCSYMARIWPVVKAFSSGSKMLSEGRLPVKVLWGMRWSGTLSARSSTAVLPLAKASACAKKLHMSSSWLDTTSPCIASQALEEAVFASSALVGVHNAMLLHTTVGGSGDTVRG